MNGNSRGALALDEVGGTAGCVKDNVLYYPQRPFGDNAYASIGTGSDPGHVSQCTSSSGAIFSGPMATFDLTKLKLTPPFHLK